MSANKAVIAEVYRQRLERAKAEEARRETEHPHDHRVDGRDDDGERTPVSSLLDDPADGDVDAEDLAILKGTDAPGPQPLTPFANGDGAQAPPPNGHTAKPAAKPKAKAAPPHRDANGRFVRGNPGGPGNPYTRKTAELRKAFLSVIDPAAMKRLAYRLITMAEYGDLGAAKLMLAYVLGKPRSEVSPDAVDLHEWALLDAAPTRYQVLAAMLDACPPEEAAELLQQVLRQKSVRERVFEEKPRSFARVSAEIDTRVGRSPGVKP